MLAWYQLAAILADEQCGEELRRLLSLILRKLAPSGADRPPRHGIKADIFL
jgi:hypothetical protein